MKTNSALVISLYSLVFAFSTAFGQNQTQTPAPAAASPAAGTTVPRLVSFSGVIKDAAGKPVTGPVSTTFSLYAEQESGTPLWQEAQIVQADAEGHYTVFLGATEPTGLPLDVFTTGAARWLAVQPAVSAAGEAARILLVGVPYALKAADADTLGGKPVSAFVTTDSQASSGKAETGTATSSSTAKGSSSQSANATPASVGGSGATNYIPRWTSSTTLGNSLFFQSGANVGLGTTTPTQRLEVDLGNVLVAGPQNFKAAGNTAFLYVGDTNHPIEAIWNTGLEIGTYRAPKAFFIADYTGNVGIGTTTPTKGILNTVANSRSVIGLSTIGWTATAGSNASGTDAIHATGGSGENNLNGTSSAPGGAGVVAQGGRGAQTMNGGNGGAGVIATGGLAGFDAGLGYSGAGVVAQGGASAPNGGGDLCCAGDGVDAVGGDPEGIGVVASGGGGNEFEHGFAGVMATGGAAGGAVNGPGVIAQGGSQFGGSNSGGDGIDAFAGAPSGGPNGLAGSFTGDVNISGNLTVSGTKSFRIDHPLDPANKYLYHASIESSEVLNLYSGNVALDASGEANVQLPEWFETLNKDFRYQLTAIGAAAPNLHIAQEIQDHSFRIGGGAAGMKVSWQVSGVRQDAWEKAHPMVVEAAKPQRERGYYMNPELFGAPAERSIEWARYPALMKRMKHEERKAAVRGEAVRARHAEAVKP